MKAYLAGVLTAAIIIVTAVAATVCIAIILAVIILVLVDVNDWLETQTGIPGPTALFLLVFALGFLHWVGWNAYQDSKRRGQ